MAPEVASRYRIVIARERGDRDAVRRLVAQHLANHGPIIGPNPYMAVDLMLALLDAQMFAETRRALAKMKQSPRADTHPLDLPVLIEGLSATFDGRPARGIQQLERFLQDNWLRSPYGLRASLGLAEARAANGQISAAIAVL